MTRPKGSKNKPKQEDNSASQEFDFSLFNQASGTADYLTALGFYNNPIWRNEILKQLASSPVKFKREDVQKLLLNPVVNEKALKDLAQYLMNNSMHFKRIVHYFATILDFRYFMRPVGVTAQEAKSKMFDKCRRKSLDWLEKFNIKYEFGNIMETLILEDAGFYYLRENNDRITLQRMPTDYCKIVDRTDLGYVYAFNMVYFMRPGVNLQTFAPEFEEYYNEFINGDSSVPFYWKDLPPEKAFVFKWDENFAGVIPVLIGLYLDTIEIDEFKQLLKSKTVLENWKILFQKIPMKTGDKAELNDFLIDPTTSGKFHSNIKSSLPSGTTILTSPMDVQAINFEQSESRNNIVGYGESNFFNSAGVSPIVMGGAVSSSAGLNQSITVDGAFVDKMYHQFARFVNFQLSQVSGKYKFKIVFPDGTRFNKQESFDNAMSMASVGFPATLVACHNGLEPNDLEQLMIMEDAMGIKEKLVPLMSSYTQSGNEGGAPSKADSKLSDSAIKTRDNESNDPNKRGR